VDSLQDLVANHNSSPSLDAAGKKTAPIDVTEKKELMLRVADSKRAADVRRRVDRMGVVPGTQVRLLTSRLRLAPKYVKGQEAAWTPELYGVIERVGPNAFKVDVPAGEVSVWPVHSLQIVKKALGQSKPAGQKVDKKVVAAKKKEALSISPAENEAALAAPARPKRDRAKKVDYAKLAGKK
jgi:Fe2+ transport system protein FeoA